MNEVTHCNLPQSMMVLLQEVNSIKDMISSFKNVKEESSKPHERLTRNEVRDEFKISFGTIHNLMRSGKLTYEKMGKKTLFKRSDVEAYFQSKSKNLSSNG